MAKMKRTTGIRKKPKVQLVGTDSNIFAMMGLCSVALKRDGQGDKVEQMREEVLNCSNSDDALMKLMEYCDVS